MIRKAIQEDIEDIAFLNHSAFHGSKTQPISWIQSWFDSYPMYQYFITEQYDVIVGYVGWQIHGGFEREEPIIELEQLVVKEEYRGKGVATELIEESLKEVVAWVKESNPRAKELTMIVWGYSDNLAAMKTYLKSFTDGVVGTRIQYGDKVESMLRRKIKL